MSYLTALELNLGDNAVGVEGVAVLAAEIAAVALRQRGALATLLNGGTEDEAWASLAKGGNQCREKWAVLEEMILDWSEELHLDEETGGLGDLPKRGRANETQSTNATLASQAPQRLPF